MNTQVFVDALKQVVVADSIRVVESHLRNPPGKKPAQEVVKLSEWFRTQSNDDQDMILKLVKKSVETSVFGFLCVLDGVRAFEGREEKGRLKLIYESGSESILLNDPDVNEALHDLL